MKILVYAIFLTVVLHHVSATTRITSSLQIAFKTQSTVDIIIEMKSSTTEVLKRVRAQSFTNSDQKATTLYNELRKFTANSQKEVLSVISLYKTAKVQGFYLTNKISVKNATLELAEALNGRNDIAEISVEKVIYLEDNHFVNVNVKSSGKALQWGVDNIGAPTTWSNNITGEGIVVSNIDTGVRYTHEALISGYRAEYGWFDPFQGSELPNDQSFHGTHTMGIIAGRNGTGVAPGATWVACKGCDVGACTFTTIFKCMEWTFCPTLQDGTGEDCTKRPHVSSNSWAGGNDDPSYNDAIDAWNEVGIIPVFSVGNAGSLCRTVHSPGDQPNVIGVGATDQANEIAFFSGRGPSARNLLIKPDVSAPGLDVVSCGIENDTSYVVASGTSMSTPHVAGAVALLLHKNRSLNVHAIATALGESAFRPEMGNITCTGGGVDLDNPWPNNAYGYGKIDVAKAVENV